MVRSPPRDRQAVERAEFCPAHAFRVSVPGRAPRPLDVKGDDRVRRLVVGVDAAQVDLEQFLTRDLTRSQRANWSMADWNGRSRTESFDSVRADSASPEVEMSPLAHSCKITITIVR